MTDPLARSIAAMQADNADFALTMECIENEPPTEPVKAPPRFAQDTTFLDEAMERDGNEDVTFLLYMALAIGTGLIAALVGYHAL
jgi:hypothetical protein